MLHLCSAPPSHLCLDLCLPFCLALLYFYLLWLLRLSLPYLTPAAQHDSVAIIIFDLFWSGSGAMKKYNCLLTIRPDSADQFGRSGRFDFRLHIRFRFYRLQFIFQLCQIRFRQFSDNFGGHHLVCIIYLSRFM